MKFQAATRRFAAKEAVSKAFGTGIEFFGLEGCRGAAAIGRTALARVARAGKALAEQRGVRPFISVYPSRKRRRAVAVLSSDGEKV